MEDLHARLTDILTQHRPLAALQQAHAIVMHTRDVDGLWALRSEMTHELFKLLEEQAGGIFHSLLRNEQLEHLGQARMETLRASLNRRFSRGSGENKAGGEDKIAPDEL